MSSNNETRSLRGRRSVLAAVLALVVCGALAIAAGAGNSPVASTEQAQVLTKASPTDSCGYPGASTLAYPRGATDFNESDVLRGFKPANAAFVGDDIVAYYSDEWALTLGGANADQSTSANGSDDTNINFGGALGNTSLVDLSSRPLMPVLYVTKVADGQAANRPAAGDWQSGSLHNGTGFLPDEIHGGYGGVTHTKDRPANGLKDGSLLFDLIDPATGKLVSTEKYTAIIVWHVDDLNLNPTAPTSCSSWFTTATRTRTAATSAKAASWRRRRP